MTAAGELEFVNQRAMDHTGWTLERMKDWPSLTHPDDLPLVAKLWSRAVATGHPYEVEHRILCSSGAFRWLHVNGLPPQGEEGRIIRIERERKTLSRSAYGTRAYHPHHHEG